MFSDLFCGSGSHCSPSSMITDPNESSVQGLAHAFSMIIVSEVGDKTFIVAALLAMRHPRGLVFAGAFGSLIVMSVLSAAMGHVLPSLIPKKWTQVAAALLFLVFGVKMLIEGKEMKAGNEKMQEEMREVEEEIENEDAQLDGTGGRALNGRSIPLEEMEEGGRKAANGDRHVEDIPEPLTPSRSTGGIKEGARNFFALFLGPVFVQAFVLTFLGEWGDRSQIATIALAAAHNVYIVIIGTVVGHGLCTAVAVLGGRWLATKISVKHVTLGGAVLFILFAVIYFHEAFSSTEDPLQPGLSPEVPSSW